MLLSLSLLATSALAQAIESLEGLTFENYAASFEKAYPSTEVAARKALFETRLAEIIAHNSKDSTYKMGVNQYTDMTDSERKALLGYKRKPHQPSSFQAPRATAAPPASVDWRTKGAVSAVKDQGSCGSCWAFATVETVESSLQIATGKLLTLSPQNVVSCTKNPDHCGGTGGCSGATAELGFQYIADKGVSDEATWPYKHVDGTCTEKAKVAKVKGFVKLAENEQDPLVDAVATVGPIAISVSADAWFAYSKGIFDGCGVNAVIDHAVQLVGYGTENNVDYWIVRNSWGASWGEKGYIRIKKFASSKDHCGIDKSPADGSGCTGGPSQVPVCGMCGILYDSSYPVGTNFTTL